MSKSIQAFLSELKQLDIKIWIEEDRLKCNAPKGALTPELKAELSNRKVDIIAFLQENQGIQITKTAIKPQAERQNLPLSFAQQRLWFIDQFEGKNATYNMPGVLKLEGNLNSTALENSINKIIQRQESLRTRFDSLNGEAIQIIDPERFIKLEIISLEQLEPQEQQFQTQQLIKQEIQKPFNLSQDLLIRASLIKLGTENHILVMTMHHIISDGWSIGVFIQELSILYSAYIQSQEANLPSLSIQYADYAVWQREWLSGEQLQNQIDYWKQKLSGLPPLLELPTDYSRPPKQSFKGSHQRFTLPQELSQKLKQLSQQTGVTLFMTLLSGFSILLARYARSEDIAIASPIANRHRGETESLIGFFVNTLIMRVNLEDNLTVKELLQQIRKTCLEAYAHQDIPFEKLVEELKPERNLSYSPLFQVMFVLQNTPEEELKLSGLNLSPVDINLNIAKFDLTLSITENDLGLKGEWEYNTDLFEKATIERMMGHFQVLLEAMVTNPQEKVSKLPILTKGEKQQILVEWNNTAAEYPKDKCIHQLFEEQVLRTPDAVAVVYEEQQLTYQELNKKANQLAHYLQKLGVKPDTLVGICVERSLEMVIGLLGILKAGGAYIPIDPNYPGDRIAYIISDSQVQILLTKQSLIPNLPEHQSQIILLNAEHSDLAEESQENLHCQNHPNNLAYVIYTSGSTGKPKGVLINHANVTRLFSATQHWYQFNEKDVWTLFHSYAFDFSVWELWGGLFYGGRVVIVPYFISRSPEEFYQLLYRERVTVLNQTPSAFQQLIRVDEISENQKELNLRLVIFGGEALDIPSLKPWFDRHGDSQPQLVNMYGITETTVHVTYRPITQADLSNSSSVIGCPIPDLQVYILDQNLQPVPIGVPGEMCVGGDGVARGYLNRSELTAQRFILNPFNNSLGQRLYRSGDLARYLPNGDIEYLGRIDHQVKIRGFRIELGEIESLISTHPDIRETVVIASEDQPGNKRLVAYMVSNLMAEGNLSQKLREYLKEKLPDYMIPSAFVVLEKLPLTSNGKVDRKALPKPDFDLLANAEDFVAPRTPKERKLAQVWCNVLRLSQVSIKSNFFELGGDSILSIQIVSRAKQAGLKITPKQLFEHQTIADLALVTQEEELLEAEQGLLTGVAPLTPIQHWFFEQNLPEIHHWNQATLLEVTSDLELDKLTKVTKALWEHHDALRFKYEKTEESWQQIYTQPHHNFSIEVRDLSHIASTEQLSVIETQSTQWQQSLNLSEGQLLRVVLFQLGNNQPSRLLIIIHHLAVDGVSWRILLEDLVTAYGQLIKENTIQFPAKTTSYQQWGEKLIEYAQSEPLKAQLDYWRAFLTAKNYLPVDHCVNLDHNREASTLNLTVSLTSEQTQALLKKVPVAYNTQINDILLTALVQTFAQWTEKSSLLLDLEGHGREDLFEGIDLSRTVGWFTSIFPVQLQLTPQSKDDPGEAIKSIKEQLRQIPQKGIGYGILRYLNQDQKVQEQLSQIPQPQISFNYLGQFDQMGSSPPILGFASESSGLSHSQHCLRRHLIDINSQIVSGQLTINWTYSRNFHRRETIEALAHNYQSNLQSLISYCQSTEAGGFTRSDFPAASLNQKQLDQLLSQIRPIDKVQGIEDIYDLSPTQQGLLFHTLYSPESSVYFEQSSFKLEGSLDSEAFRYAWEQLVQRHAILRTAFYEKGLEQPLQVVFKKINLPWLELDWRCYSSDEQGQHLKEWLRQDQQQGIDLLQAPLMRCTLIDLSPHTYQFIWTYHDILLDGWSVATLFQELWSFYHSYHQAYDLQLKSPRPYRDYIRWLQQKDLGKAEIFWRERLKGFIAPTPLMVDQIVQLADYSDEYKVQYSQLSESVTEQLKSVAKQHRITLNIIIQAAWSFLLSCYSGESDVVFGTTVSGRPPELEGIESMVGLFINTLPVRVKIPQNGSLLSWIQELNCQYREQESYFYTPLFKVLEWSDIPRGTGLFESLVIFENYPIDSQSQAQDSNLKILEYSVFERTNFPLLLLLSPGQNISIMVSYMANRFASETIERMLGHLTVILGEIANNPQLSLADLSPLTQAERQQILVSWNNTARDYPQNLCLHQLIESQVLQSPEAMAVIFESQTLTYSELNAKANQLANYLRDQGIQPDSLVGICVERSLEMVIGLLGILKAGAAYVPIDPGYPSERISYMLEDSQVSILLTQAKLMGQLPPTEASFVCLDDDWIQIESYSSHNPHNITTVDHLAYVIYTSGSTGKPKGAMNCHDGIVNRLRWMQEAYALDESDRILQKTPFSFDVSVWEFFWPLMAGATLVLAKPEGHKDSNYLVNIIRDEQITTLHFVPPMLQVFLEDPDISECTSLKRVICSGEALPYDLQERFFSRLDCELHNLYGPTEAAIDVSYWQCQPQSDLKKVPIGRPVANTQLYILNQHLQPVPIGAVGELHIGGVQVGKGYLNRPELTAEKFIRDSFSQVPNTRLYKTGDLCRYLPDGNIEYLGRIDHQVKIRGFRIELGEIEATLKRHHSIQNAIVTVQDNGVDKNLVAYIVPVGESPYQPFLFLEKAKTPIKPWYEYGNNPLLDKWNRQLVPQIREFLQQMLPDYMVPFTFVVLDALPLTPNGKIDRRSLPVPTTLTRSIDQTFIAPRDAVEQKLVQYWEEILDIYPVSIKDNFFDLGGHSLLAVRLMAMLQSDFQQHLPLASLFQYATPEKLANVLRSSDSESVSWSPLVTIQPHGNGIPLFFVPGAGGNVIYLYDLAQALGTERPFYGLQSIGLDGESIPLTSIEEIAKEHILAIQTVQPEGPYLLAGHSFGGLVVFEMAHQLQQQGEKVALLSILDLAAPQPTDGEDLKNWDDATWICFIIQLFNQLWNLNLEAIEADVRQLSSDAQLHYLKDRLQQANVIAPNGDIRQVRGLFQVFKANHNTRYIPQFVLQSPITLLRAQEGSSDTTEEALWNDTYFGWQQWTTENINVHFIPGNHLTMMAQPQVKVLADCLNLILNNALADN